MRRPQGYLVIADPAAPLVEQDTITCAHCQGIVCVKPGSGATVYLLRDRAQGTREVPGAFCRSCMAPICVRCCDRGSCTPWERQLAHREARDRLLRAVGVA